MLRLHADADEARWVPVTGSLGLRGRRHRKKAIRMLLGQAAAASGAGGPRRGGGVMAWAMSQTAPMLLRRADGRVRVWVWKDEPELAVALAQVQQLTPQLRMARAMLPIEYDDTEDFRSPNLGSGEKLDMTMPPAGGAAAPPTVTYTWDSGTHLVTLTVVSGDRERFGTVMPALDVLARRLRVVDDVTLAPGDEPSGGEPGAPPTLRIDPS